MKLKTILSTVLVAFFSAIITLFVYSNFIGGSNQKLSDQRNGQVARTAPVSINFHAGTGRTC